MWTVWLIDFAVYSVQPVTCVTRASTRGQDCGNIGWSTPGRDLTMIDWIDWCIDWCLWTVWLIDFAVYSVQPVTCVTRASTLGQDCGNIGWSTPARDLTMIDWIDWWIDWCLWTVWLIDFAVYSVTCVTRVSTLGQVCRNIGWSTRGRWLIDWLIDACELFDWLISLCVFCSLWPVWQGLLHSDRTAETSDSPHRGETLPWLIDWIDWLTHGKSLIDWFHHVYSAACDLCDKGFYTRTGLRKHRVVHTGGRPYHDWLDWLMDWLMPVNCLIDRFRCVLWHVWQGFLHSYRSAETSGVPHGGDDWLIDWLTPVNCLIDWFHCVYSAACDLRKHRIVHTGERPYHDLLIGLVDWLIVWRLWKDWLILLCTLQPVTCVTRASTLGQDSGNIGWSTQGRDLIGIVPSWHTLFSALWNRNHRNRNFLTSGTGTVGTITFWLVEPEP